MPAADAPAHDPPHDPPHDAVGPAAGRRAVRRRRPTPWTVRERPWLRDATLAAAAAIGALVGFGMPDGASLARLGVVTLRLRGLPEFVSPDRNAAGAALLGGVHVALVSGAWGAGVGTFGRWMARRGIRPVTRAAALAGAGVVMAVIDGLLPRPLRLAAGALNVAERVLVALLVAAAAWGASRLVARPPSPGE